MRYAYMRRAVKTKNKKEMDTFAINKWQKYQAIIYTLITEVNFWWQKSVKQWIYLHVSPPQMGCARRFHIYFIPKEQLV